MTIQDLLERQFVAVRPSVASKRAALALVAELANQRFGVSADVILECLLDREAQGSTGLGHGVAVPHARLRGLNQMMAVFIRLDQPVEFDAVDDLPVDLICGLFSPEDASHEHLRALARISRSLRQSDLRAALRHAKDADGLFTVLSRPGASEGPDMPTAKIA